MSANPQDVEALAAIVGASNVLTWADLAARRDDYQATGPMQGQCLVRPRSTQEVSAILAYCGAHGIKIVPQGGCTGLVHGARTAVTEVALSLERMRQIEEIDVIGGTILVQAGTTLQAVQEAAAAERLYYPVDLGARGTATIGGTISTNAGGNSVFRYGMTRDQVLGLEVVLADGTVLSSLNRLVKNNAGYDLKHMFIGAEGTLGVITRAVLRLRSDPGERVTVFLGLDKFDDVIALLQTLSSAFGPSLTSFEVMWSEFIEIVLSVRKHPWPLSGRYGFNVIVETSGRSRVNVEDCMAQVMEQGRIADAVVAQDGSQASAIWSIRDDVESLGKVGDARFLYDISLPQVAMARYIEGVRLLLRQRRADARLVVFGHIADNNLHVLVYAGHDDHTAVDDIVYGPLKLLNGSVSAEHGIGLEKRRHLPISRSEAEIEMMRRLKEMLDPHFTLNNGKVLGVSRASQGH